LKRPFKSLRQKWHTVGFVYECTTNVCGILMRPAISFSIQNGLPALIDERPCFCMLGLVLPLEGVFETLRMTEMVEMDSSLHEMESDELRGRSVALGRGRNESVSSDDDASDDDERRLRVYEQLLGILYTHRLWKLRAQYSHLSP